jgi:predicted ATPase
MMYSAFAFRIDSEIALDLPTATEREEDSANSVPLRTVKIREAPVREEFELQGSTEFFSFGQANGCLRIDIHRIGRFKVLGMTPGAPPEGSIVVHVEPFPGVAPYALAHSIDTVVLTFLLHSREITTLHGSAVALDGRGVILVGSCGSGKSTTAAALASKGWAVLCDDLVPISRDAERKAMFVLPGIAAPSLLPDAFERLSIASVREPSGCERPSKRRMQARRQASPVPLAAIFCLEPGDVEEPVITKISGYRKVSLLVQHLNSIPGLDDAKDQLVNIFELQAMTDLFLIVRPKRKDSLAAVAALIEGGAGCAPRPSAEAPMTAIAALSR